MPRELQRKEVGFWLTLQGAKDRAPGLLKAISEKLALHPAQSGSLEMAASEGDKMTLAIRSTAKTLLLYQRAGRVRMLPGARYRLRLVARGRGDVRLGCSAGKVRAADPATLVFGAVAIGAPTALTEDPRALELEFTADGDMPRVFYSWLEISGDGAHMFASEYQVNRVWDSRVRIEAPHVMTPVGVNASVPIRLLSEGKPLARRELIVVPHTERDVLPQGQTVRIATDGAGGVAITAVADADRLLAWTIVDPVSGAMRRCYVDVAPPELFAEFEAAAARIDIEKPLHCLYLGDSLTDFHRGYNYADKLDFWFNRRSRGKATFKNAAVGGDTVTRLWAKLHGKGFSQYHRDRYPEWDDVLSPRPDWVFFFFGHNDCKLTAASKLTESFVPLSEFAKTYQDALDWVRERTHGRMILLSMAATRRRQVKSGNIFGDPEIMPRYNAAIEELARTRADTQFVDVHTPMANTPNPASLFIPDGIHINNAGNRVVALEVLRALSLPYPSGQTTGGEPSQLR